MHFFARHWFLSLVSLAALFVIITLLPFARLIMHPFRLAGGEKNYLILLQNNYELRATGGFVTAFATLKLKNGIPQNLSFEDVYGSIDDHEYIEPPFPLGELLADPSYYKGHSFRDANIHPDFPTSVANFLSFYRKTRPFQTFNGVFALDFDVFEEWLRLVGPLKIEGTEWDSEHFFEILTHQVADFDLHNPEQASQRKQQFASLLSGLAKKTLWPWNIARFSYVLKNLLDEKHILLYLDDSALQEDAAEYGWGGAMNVREGEDFLAVIDANYGGLKSNRYVTRDIFYRIDLEAGESTIEMTYRHSGEYNIPLSGDYRGYLRAFVPKNHNPRLGSDVFVSEDPNFTVAGSLVKIPIRSSLQKQFSFSFPRSTFRESAYTLNLWKQPGTFSDFYRIFVRIPSGMRVLSEDFEARENIAVFEGFLKEDRRLSLVFEKDPLPPRAILQDLVKLDEFNLMWNEPIDPVSAKKENVKIVDMNTASSRADLLTVASIGYEGNLLRIKTSGMSVQPEEHYLMKISGISDFHGNAIPERTYTFVQRLK